MRALAALCILTASVSSAATLYLSTDQSGAVNQIALGTPVGWTFTASSGFDFGGGIFEMKRGSSATDSITLRFYQGSNNSGTLLDSVTLLFSAFTQSYSTINFFFTNPISLTAGSSYFAELTSAATGGGSDQYFIKDGISQIVDSTGTPVNPSAVPEPGTLTMLAASLLALRVLRK